MVPSQDSTKNKLQIADVLSSIPKFTGIVDEITVIASASHEYMYFWIVGRELLSSYMPADYLKVAVRWLPSFLLMILLILAVVYKDTKTRLEIYSKDPEQASEIYKWPDRVQKALDLIVVVTAICFLPFITWANIGIFVSPFCIAAAYVLIRPIFGRIKHRL